jgi:hypothetical protein
MSIGEAAISGASTLIPVSNGDNPDKRAGRDDGPHSLDLPCGTKADFQVRSSFSIRWLDPE